jgi:hypothetical protein
MPRRGSWALPVLLAVPGAPWPTAPMLLIFRLVGGTLLLRAQRTGPFGHTDPGLARPPSGGPQLSSRLVGVICGSPEFDFRHDCVLLLRPTPHRPIFLLCYGSTIVLACVPGSAPAIRAVSVAARHPRARPSMNRNGRGAAPWGIFPPPHATGECHAAVLVPLHLVAAPQLALMGVPVSKRVDGAAGKSVIPEAPKNGDPSERDHRARADRPAEGCQG